MPSAPRDERADWALSTAGRRTGWIGFSAWALVGALFGLSVLGAASIGLFVMPVALVALAGVAKRVRCGQKSLACSGAWRR